MEQKYRISTKSGQILWDITRMLEDLTLFGEPVTLSVAELATVANFNGDPTYAMRSDCTRPILVARLCAGKEIVLDGNHRLYKAQQLGLSEIKAICLLPSQHQKYIIDFDKDTYDTVVREFISAD